MQHLYLNYLQHEEDDPSEVYLELDEGRREQRRIDFYQNGMCFAYGGERGQTEVHSRKIYPENPCTLNQPGELEVQLMDRSAFERLWYQAQEWPTGFMDVLS